MNEQSLITSVKVWTFAVLLGSVGVAVHFLLKSRDIQDVIQLFSLHTIVSAICSLPSILFLYQFFYRIDGLKWSKVARTFMLSVVGFLLGLLSMTPIFYIIPRRTSQDHIYILLIYLIAGVAMTVILGNRYYLKKKDN